MITLGKTCDIFESVVFVKVESLAEPFGQEPFLTPLKYFYNIHENTSQALTC